MDRPRQDAPPETLDDPPRPRVADVATGGLVAVSPDTPVRTALTVMLAERVHHLPVLDDDGRCTGMLSEADVLRGLAAQHGPLGTATLRAADVAGPAPALPPGAPLAEAARLMARHRLTAVLVVDGGRPCGIVTAADVVARYR
ncbi:CBS domain-containing protein, partial [Pseudonocardia spirodelae]